VQVDIKIIVPTENPQFGPDEATEIQLSGQVFAGQASDQGPIPFVVNIPRSADAAATHAAILAAAIAACEIREISVGVNDKKTLISGAIDL
jgi:hypothetical protein